MSIIVEPATAVNIGSLVKLNSVVQNIHANLEPSIFRDDLTEEELHAFWSDKLSGAENLIAVAKVDDVDVGYIWFEVQDRPISTFNHARRRIYVHHLVVHPNYQMTGVASGLTSYVEAQAFELGISKIVLDAWAANEPAQAFFRRVGFSPINIVLAKDLSLTTT